MVSRSARSASGFLRPFQNEQAHAKFCVINDPEGKHLFHQIHPLKLLHGLVNGLIALYLLWRHELAVAVPVMLVPPPVASWLIMRYDDRVMVVWNPRRSAGKPAAAP